jgi:hypothetical protein
MKTRLFFLICIVAFLGFQAYAVELCGRYDLLSVNNGDLMAQNNIWGATTAQCISVNGAGFTVTRSEHNIATSGSPAAYPSLFKGCHWTDCTTNSGMPIQVSQIQNATINWSVSLPSSGTYNVTTEAWFKTNNTPGQPDGAELMIWINHAGSVQPGGSQIGTVTINGTSWQVWYASIGWNFITYKTTSPTTSVNLDYKPFIQDAMSRGYIQNGWYMMDIEAGFEIWQGGVGLAVTNFSAAINQGSVTNPPVTPEPTATPSVTNPPSCPVPGDVNGSGARDIVDALLLAQYYVGLNPPNFNLSCADVNCSGTIDIVDALILAQCYVGLNCNICIQ